MINIIDLVKCINKSIWKLEVLVNFKEGIYLFVKNKIDKNLLYDNF